MLRKLVSGNHNVMISSSEPVFHWIQLNRRFRFAGVHIVINAQFTYIFIIVFRRIRMRTVRSTSEDLWMVRKHIQTPPVRISLRAGFRVRDSPSTYE